MIECDCVESFLFTLGVAPGGICCHPDVSPVPEVRSAHHPFTHAHQIREIKMASLSVDIGIEGLLEHQVEEISRDGQEKYVP